MYVNIKIIFIFVVIACCILLWSDITPPNTFIISQTDRNSDITSKILPYRASNSELETAKSRKIYCENGPKKNVMYLKTHKTGSSTLQSILARNAFKNDLFVGILKQENLKSGRKFTRTDLMPIPPNKTLNMIIKEIIFDQQEVSAIMPADTIYITTIREPAKHFESSFHYLYKRVDAYQRAKTENPKLDYLTNGDKYYKGISDKGPLQYWWFGKNPLFFELGYDNVNEDNEYIREAISEIDKHFDLVMIMEYFDISIILLMDILCWNMEDLLFVTLNARNPDTVEEMSSDISDKVYKWNKADADLYKHFNSTFWKRVDKYGRTRMEENLIRFRKMKQKLFEDCFENNTINQERRNKVKYKALSMELYQIRNEAKMNSTCTDFIIEGWKWYHKIKMLEYRDL